MIERLISVTIILAICIGIGLIIFLPARWLAFRNNPEARHQIAPKKTVALWVGTPIFCVYAFAIHPALGATALAVAFVMLGVALFVELKSMTAEQRGEIAKAVEAKRQEPLAKIIRYIAYGCVVIVAWNLASEFLG